ncbi:S8 family serine peptidase [Leptotrichia sp. HSP-334]|uniref:S8 family serine peptidase n=1 Tax=Leptotrichia rugosa TaxID=3239302 RepID=A0AB39VGJ2_9FUSO
MSVKKIKFLIMLFSIVLNVNIFCAKLNYTNKKTKVSDYDVKENIVKYQKSEYKKGQIYYAITDNTTGYDNWEKEVGGELPRTYLPKNWKKIGKHPLKDQAGEDHTTLVTKTFLETAGLDASQVINYGAENEWNMMEGIFSYSTSTSYYSPYMLTDNAWYFGNVINETLLNNYMPRLATTNTDDRNLLIIALPNAEKRKNGSNADVILNDATAKFPLYSDEVEKLFRSQRIMVDAANCFVPGKKDVTNPILLNESYRGKRISDFSSKCTMSQMNNEVGADALYARGNTIVALGNIYSRVDGSNKFGTSFATPRTAGYATLILNKFKGLTYHQVKEILLTTAYRERDRLDNQMGWGIVDIRKALNGPTNLNAGLIEENKFYTGMYDKIFNKKSNDIYFWAEPETDWVWSNDIDSGLSDKPSGTSSYIVSFDKNDNSKTKRLTIQNYLPSEENFYKETSKYVPGLRKAGKHKLTITGDLLYGGETQVLEGTLKLTGNIPDSTIVVYEGATLELCGNANKVVLAGGKIEACPSAKYTLVNEDREDIEVNKTKVIDIPKLFYFTQSDKIETKNFKNYDKYNKFLNQHYNHITGVWNLEKMPENEFFGTKNQVYAHDYSYKLTGKWDFTDTYEFYKYMTQK